MNTIKLRVEKVEYANNGNTTVCNIVFSFPSLPFVVAAIKDSKARNILDSNSVMMKNDSSKTRNFIYTKGITNCSPNDKFDEKTGRKIAYSKAYLEGYKKFYQICFYCKEALYSKYYEMVRNRGRIKDIISSEEKYLKTLTNK